MKQQVTNIIATLGFILLFVTFVLAVLVGVLFLVPDATIGDMVAVNERDTQIVYCDEALKTAFARGNFIIESDNCAVTVQVNAAGYVGESTVVVNESATGIAFNSRKRTLIEWTSTLVDNIPYCKIKVLEPSGIVVNKKPTMVYLNLSSQTAEYNFILQNNYSDVTFRYGDDVDPERGQLHINRLVVRSASKVTIPSYDTITIDEVAIPANNTQITCGGVVNGNVTVTGARSRLNFNNTIKGNVLLNGEMNKFRATKTGDIIWGANNGNLTVNECEQLKVDTTDATVNVGTIKGGVTMNTVNGSLTVGEISRNGLNFTATAKANVSVSGRLVGNAVVNNSGVGEISLLNVVGNVDIESSRVNGGKINVAFGEVGDYSTKIRGYDGDIVVKNIYGDVDIRVRDNGAGGAAGRAKITTYFNYITASTDNIIVAGAYVNSPAGMGDVEVYLQAGWNNFRLTVSDARSAWAFANTDHAKQLERGTNYISGGAIGSTGNLKVVTPADVRVY